MERESRNSEFNGWQIRNVVSTALGLARAKRAVLVEDLDIVTTKTRTFHNELRRQREIYKQRQMAISER